MGLFVVMLSCFLLPIDVWTVSSFKDASSGAYVVSAEQRDAVQSAIQTIYIVLYALALGWLFVVLPFAFFFVSKSNDERTCCASMLHSIKFVVVTTILLGVLLTLGFTLQPDLAHYLDDAQYQWIRDLFADSTPASHAFTFMIASTSVLGFLVFTLYTGVGLAALPVSLIRRRFYSLDAINERLSRIKVERRSLMARSSTIQQYGGAQIRREHEERQRKVEDRFATLRTLQCRGRCYACARPVLMILGVLFLLLALFVAAVLCEAVIDRVIHSPCGSGVQALECGYVLGVEHAFNPIDGMLHASSVAFPVDLLLLSLLLLLLLVATLVGVGTIGVRLLCFRLYRIERRGTEPQGLVLAVVSIMLASLIFNIAVVNLAPQYSFFGSQRYVNGTAAAPAHRLHAQQPLGAGAMPRDGQAPANGTLINCDVVASGNCTMTVVAQMTTRLSVQMPFFGVVYLWGSLAVVVMFLLALVVMACCACRRRGADDDDDDDGGVGGDPTDREFGRRGGADFVFVRANE